VKPDPSAAQSEQKTPRIAFFSDSLAERNGTGAYYFDLLESLSRCRAQVLIKIFQPLRDVRLNYLSIPMPGDPSQRLITPNLFRIRKGLKALNPDTVVIVTPGPFGLVGYLYARKHKLRCITAFHTNFEQLTKIYWNPINRSMANLYLRSVNQLLCQNSDSTLIHNSSLVAVIEALGAKNHHLMGTPLPQYFIEKPIVPAPPTVKQICYAGRLAPEKNIDYIIKAAAHFPEIKFCIIGEGPLKNSLVQQARPLKNVQFMSWLNREELVNIIDLSNALILPSKIETFGSVAYEAMARGRPVIVSKDSGIVQWEHLRQTLIILQRPEDLSQAIHQLVDMHPEERTRVSDQSHRAARDFHEQTLNQWVDLLRSKNRVGK